MRSHVYNNPADDPEALPFLRGIAEAPGDPLARMGFADWLQENGYDNAAAGQRFAAKHGKYPQLRKGADRTLGGWYQPQRSGTAPIENDVTDQLRAHSLPMVYHNAQTNPNLGGLFNNSPHPELTYETHFLSAANGVEHDADNEPLSKFKPDQLGYQTDIRP